MSVCRVLISCSRSSVNVTLVVTPAANTTSVVTLFSVAMSRFLLHPLASQTNAMMAIALLQQALVITEDSTQLQRIAAGMHVLTLQRFVCADTQPPVADTNAQSLLTTASASTRTIAALLSFNSFSRAADAFIQCLNLFTKLSQTLICSAP